MNKPVSCVKTPGGSVVELESPTTTSRMGPPCFSRLGNCLACGPRPLWLDLVGSLSIMPRHLSLWVDPRSDCSCIAARSRVLGAFPVPACPDGLGASDPGSPPGLSCSSDSPGPIGWRVGHRGMTGPPAFSRIWSLARPLRSYTHRFSW